MRSRSTCREQNFSMRSGSTCREGNLMCVQDSNLSGKGLLMRSDSTCQEETRCASETATIEVTCQRASMTALEAVQKSHCVAYDADNQLNPRKTRHIQQRQHGCFWNPGIREKESFFSRLSQSPHRVVTKASNNPNG